MFRASKLFAIRDAIKAGDCKEFTLLLSCPDPPSKRLDLLSFVPLYCVVYDQPKMLKILSKRKVGICMPGIPGLTISLLQVAEALGHEKCCRKIAKYSWLLPQDDDKSSDQYFYTLCKDIFCIHMALVDEHLTITCLRKFAARGYDVNSRGPGGSTPLHEALDRNSSVNIIATLFAIGSDVNLTDSSGVTVLCKCLMNSNYYRSLCDDSSDETIKLLKVTLSENPSVEVFMNEAMAHSFNYLSVEHKELLVECGFRHPSFLEGLDPSPRPLKEQSRNVFRQRYPGKALFAKVEALTLPRSIKEYIQLQHWRGL